MVTTANPAQCETERLDKPAELGEADIAHVTGGQSIPKVLSA